MLKPWSGASDIVRRSPIIGRICYVGAVVRLAQNASNSASIA
jgi:hypothetical protein